MFDNRTLEFPELHRLVSRFDFDDMEDDTTLWTFHGHFRAEDGNLYEIWITDGDYRYDVIEGLKYQQSIERGY